MCHICYEPFNPYIITEHASFFLRFYFIWRNRTKTLVQLKKKKKKKNIRSSFYLGRSRSVRRVTNLSSDNYSRRVTRFATFQFPSPSKSINYNRASNYSVRGRRLFVFSRKKKVSLSRRPGLSRCASSVRREHAFLVVSFHPSPRGISHSRLRRALLCAYVIADKAATFHDDRWFNLFFLPFIHVTDS